MKKDRERYYKFSTYLRSRFGCSVRKISVDAGFSCPNKDGKLGTGGCIYCDNRAFSVNTRLRGKPLETQIREGIDAGKRKRRARKFIVYFQAHSNTYGAPGALKEKYDVVKKFKDVAGIAIGTRPDCVDEAVLDVIEGYTGEYEVWVEYGLQSIHRKTLEFINRNHSYSHFLNAVELTKKRNIKICAHVIIGLPRETQKEIIETAKELGRLKLDGVKIHPLHIIKNTKMESLLDNRAYNPLELNEFADLCADFLSYLWPGTVIQRITADCPGDLLVSPLWMLDKRHVLNAIQKRIEEKNIFQGKFYRD